MSDTTALTDLARFIGQSQLAGDEAAAWALAGGGKQTTKLKPRVAKRGVGDLLGVVLTLSARTRRTMMPKVDIDLDVFSPNGDRAVKLIMPNR